MVTKSPDELAATTRLQMSYEEYLEWSDEDSHAEWVDGEVIVHMPPRNEHQELVGFLFALVREFVNLFDVGRVQIAPFEVKLWPGGPSREPDIFFLKQENLHRLGSKRLEGPPDLIIEVVSPDSVHRDRDEKYHEYAQAGVPEYWIIDSRPGRQRADFYRLANEGRYQLLATEDDERVESPVLVGFWLNPRWLWQEPKPNVITTLYNLSSETAAAIHKRLNNE